MECHVKQRDRSRNLIAVVQLVGPLDVRIAFSVRFGGAREPHRVRRPVVFVRWEIAISAVGRAIGIFDKADVGQLARDDPRVEVIGVVVNDRSTTTTFWSPHVEPMLSPRIETETEESKLLERPCEVVGMLQDIADEHLVHTAQRHAAHVHEDLVSCLLHRPGRQGDPNRPKP